MKPGERSLEVLLRDMNPLLHDGPYVFVQTGTVPDEAVATFREEEGLTVIVERRQADALALSYSSLWAWITLTVHSDLAAVGFLAEVAGRLARAGISCNAFAAVMHDHIFVPYDRRFDALRALTGDAASPS